MPSRALRWLPRRWACSGICLPLPLPLALAVPAVAARSYVTQIPELLASSPASDWQRIDDYRRAAALPNAE